jgi:putative SOS response-associated peptidase YedK
MLHTWTDMFESYKLISTPLNVAPRYNIAPTQPVLAIIPSQTGRGESNRGNVATHFQWGLVPSWAKEAAIGAKMINARAETVAEKPAFRHAFRRRRCLIPASGFYEWQARANGPKQPFWISAADGGLLTFAGLWESWMSADGSEIETCTIITTTASESLAPIHARMPVIVAAADFQTWLDVSDETASAAASALLRPAADGVTTARPVSTRVNSVRNDDASLIEPGEVASGGATSAAPSKNQGDLFS